MYFKQFDVQKVRETIYQRIVSWRVVRHALLCDESWCGQAAHFLIEFQI